MVSLDVGESFELPHHTLLCSATGKTQEITSKWKCTRTYTLHMQPIEWSDKQNKQLVPPPHNTPRVRSMTTPGPVPINSSSINYVMRLHGGILIGIPLSICAHLILLPECLMWVFIEPLNRGKDTFSFLPSLKDSKVLHLYPWFILKWATLYIWLERTYVGCLPSFSLSICVYSIHVHAWVWELH